METPRPLRISEIVCEEQYAKKSLKRVLAPDASGSTHDLPQRGDMLAFGDGGELTRYLVQTREYVELVDGTFRLLLRVVQVQHGR
jgi:hypothetical protein